MNPVVPVPVLTHLTPPILLPVIVKTPPVTAPNIPEKLEGAPVLVEVNTIAGAVSASTVVLPIILLVMLTGNWLFPVAG